MAETRNASTPSAGALRDAVRTFIGFVVAFALTKVVGHTMAVELSPAVEGLTVILTSAIFAFIGKALRNHGSALGAVI